MEIDTIIQRLGEATASTMPNKVSVGFGDTYSEAFEEIRDMIKGTFDREFTAKMHEWITMGKPLSSKQKDLLEKIVDRYHTRIANLKCLKNQDLATSVTAALANPVFKSQEYSPVAINEIRYIGKNTVAIRMKQGSILNKDTIKLLGVPTKDLDRDRYRSNRHVGFDLKNKVWVVHVANKYIARDLISFIQEPETKLNCDSTTAEFLAECVEPTSETSTIFIEDGKIVVDINQNELLDRFVYFGLDGEAIRA